MAMSHSAAWSTLSDRPCQVRSQRLPARSICPPRSRSQVIACVGVSRMCGARNIKTSSAVAPLRGRLISCAGAKLLKNALGVLARGFDRGQHDRPVERHAVDSRLAGRRPIVQNRLVYPVVSPALARDKPALDPLLRRAAARAVVPGDLPGRVPARLAVADLLGVRAQVRVYHPVDAPR